MAEKKIAGTTYRTEQMLARDALALMAKLIKVGGSGWDKLRGLLDDDVRAGSVNVKTVAIDALIDVVRNNPTDEVLDLIDEIAGLAQRRAPSGSYDVVEVNQFTGRMSELFELISWIMQEQFASFFGDVASSNGGRKAAAS